MDNNFQRYGSASLVIWPSIGKPALYSISKYSVKLKATIRIEMWVVAVPGKTVDQVRSELSGFIHVDPLLGIEARSHTARRGYMQNLTIDQISVSEFRNVGDTKNIDEFLAHSQDLNQDPFTEPPRDNILQIKPFLERPVCFHIIASLPLTAEMPEYLERKPFLLLNLVQSFPDNAEYLQTLYHAVCIFRRKTWENLHFIQITDIHISERNDNFLGVITKNLKTSIIKTMVDFYEGSLKPAVDRVVNWGSGVMKRIFKGKKAPDSSNTGGESEATGVNNANQQEVNKDNEEKIDESSLEQRIINPNNTFRRFIRLANLLAERGELEFIVITGDLVDFCIRAESLLTAYDYNYENTNWIRFLDILLNRTLKPAEGYELLGIEQGEELLVPIFTVPGNHDYRVGHYNIRSLGIYKHLGMYWTEAVNYEERTPWAPLETSSKCMIPYMQYINPYLDYFLKLGNHTFIFLDSGYDALLEIKSLLMAEPALTGFSNDQFEFARNLCDRISTPSPEGVTFFFSHAPIINPVIKSDYKSAMTTLKGLDHMKELEIFKESALKEQGAKNTRSDIELEYRAGTISENWTETTGLIQRVKGMALNGHTHKWREFRTERGNFATISSTGYGKKIINPFAIFWDDYTEMHGRTNPKYFEEHLPFHFQTPALGIADKHYGIPAGAYRIVEIKKNRISKITIEFLDEVLYSIINWEKEYQDALRKFRELDNAEGADN